MSIADVDVNELLLELGDDRGTELRFPDGVALPAIRTRRRSASASSTRCPTSPFFCDEPWQAPPAP
jgi:hypothetical protein